MAFLPHFEAQLGRMIWRLTSLVEGETPTSEKEYVDKLAHWLAEWATEQGASVTVHHHSVVGDFVECRWHENAPGKPIMISCHIDTVHPLGSIDKNPTHTDGDFLYGMGAYDMKGGIAVVQTVLEELQALGQFPTRPITLLFVSDEEIGSAYSRPLTEHLAKESGLVLCYEFSNYEEAIVTGRKGVGIFQVTALGRESHSGSAPDDGVNAIIELAHQIDNIQALSNREKGTLVTPAIIRGGTAHNVIPGECDLVINVRVKYRSEAERVEAALEALTQGDTFLPESELILTGEFMRPPMERDAMMVETFQILQDVSGQVFREDFRGGGSDGSLSAALGIPTLDGLGPSGEGAHSKDEMVFLPSMPRRAALLADILTKWPHIPRDDA